jgi:hypothetical protein
LTVYTKVLTPPAIWSQDIVVLQKLLSLGADTATPTTFKVINAKVKHRKSGGMPYEMNSIELTLFPSGEAKRIGGAVAAAFATTSSSQTLSSIRLLK